MKEIITTSCYGEKIQLLWQPEVEEIPSMIDDGFIPVEMAEGTKSFVDFRCLDHHNDYSNLPSACITALKYYGELKGANPAKIMVNHTDSDSVMTGLTLLGLLPYDFLKEFNPEIGILDTEPLIADVDNMKFLDIINLWKAGMDSVKKSGWSWLYGLQLWLDIYSHPEKFDKLINDMKALDLERKNLAMKEYKAARISSSGHTIMIAPSNVRGYDVLFMRQKKYSPETLEGWRHLCIISYVEKAGNIMLACPCKRVAELAFGKGGLKNVFPLLPLIEGKEWGGRESIGGSPRGITVPIEMTQEIFNIVEESFII